MSQRVLPGQFIWRRLYLVVVAKIHRIRNQEFAGMWPNPTHISKLGLCHLIYTTTDRFEPTAIHSIPVFAIVGCILRRCLKQMPILLQVNPRQTFTRRCGYNQVCCLKIPRNVAIFDPVYKSKLFAKIHYLA